MSYGVKADMMQFFSRSGGIGRRAGFKIRFPLKECGFDSLLRHLSDGGDASGGNRA